MWSAEKRAEGLEYMHPKPNSHSGRIVGISGQSLPILTPLLTIDVLWSDLHMVHEDRSLMSYESFYWTFRTARTPKIPHVGIRKFQVAEIPSETRSLRSERVLLWALSRFVKRWWTRGDSNPRPPHCERGITKAKTRRHNQLAF